MKINSGDYIEFTDLGEFPKSYVLSYDKTYEVKGTYTCGSFEIADNKGNVCWIDVYKHDYIMKVS